MTFTQLVSNSLLLIKVYYNIHKPSDPTLSQCSSVRIFKPPFLKIHFNIILLSTHKTPMRILTLMFTNTNLIHTVHVVHPPLFQCPSNLCSEYNLRSSTVHNFLHLLKEQRSHNSISIHMSFPEKSVQVW